MVLMLNSIGTIIQRGKAEAYSGNGNLVIKFISTGIAFSHF